MKKPSINLSAIERINAVPLRQALDLYRRTAEDIAKAKIRKTALDKEITDFLQKTDPDDAARLQLIATKQVQAQILPSLVTRLEDQLEHEIIPSLVEKADGLRAELGRFYAMAHDEAATQIASVFRPYFSESVTLSGQKIDPAQEVALKTDICLQISARRAKALAIMWDSQPRSNRPEHFDCELIGAAEQLLALAQEN